MQTQSTEEAGWVVRTAEIGDTLTVKRPPDDYESDMRVIDKTETDWVVTLLARPVQAPEGSNPCEIKTVKQQVVGPNGKGIVDSDEKGDWNGPRMQVVQASGVGEAKWVRVEKSEVV